MTLETDWIEAPYRNRRTGQILTERIPAEGGLHLHHDNPVSPFFARRLSPGTHPFCPDPDVLCSPATGKARVLPDLTEESELPLKGVSVTVASLLGSAAEAAPFCSGAGIILRLSPPDYHRCYFPDDGHAGPARPISGCCRSADPVSPSRIAELFHRNRCAVTQIDTAHFGPVAYVEIGAFAVGSIVRTCAPGTVVRGQEKGYFRYGGAAVVLLFAPHTIRFDEDLVRDSAAGLEVQVWAGEHIGASRMTTCD